jgi:hypothetical protein
MSTVSRPKAPVTEAASMRAMPESTLSRLTYETNMPGFDL